MSSTLGIVPIFFIFVFLVLLCILLIVRDDKHVFMFHKDIFTICIFTLVSYLLKCFLIELFFYCRVLRVLCIF